MSVKFPPIIDSHCHLDFDAFDHDRVQVLAACAHGGVSDIIIPATHADAWPRSITTCDSASNGVKLHLALGMHPMFIEQHQPQHLVELDQLLSNVNTIAVGEIGLDFHKSLNHTEALREKQRVYFYKQLVIAKKHNKPVIVHIRKAHDECIRVLHDVGIERGIIHAFNGSVEHAKHYANLGFYMGFGGMLTYPHSRRLQSLVKQIPIEHIVLETDAPDMVVANHRGTRNSPAYLPIIRDSVAQHKGLDVNVVAKQTTQNIINVFSLNDTDSQ